MDTSSSRPNAYVTGLAATERHRTSHSSGTPRILFVAEAVSLSHVARPAVLARWAQEAGYEVCFACGTEYADVARGEGLDPLPLETIPSERFYGRLRAGRFFYTAGELEDYVAAERALIRRIKPDLIAGDFRLSLDISARLAGVALLALQNAHWSPAAECSFPAPNAGFFKFLPFALRARLFDLLRPLAFRSFAAPLNRVRKRHGLPGLDDFRHLYTAGRWCAYLDLPDLFPLARALPSGHFFLGPVPWTPRTANFTTKAQRTPRTALKEVLPEPSLCPSCLCGEKRALIYVTLGSSGEARVLPEVLRALAAAGCEIVLSGVREPEADGLRAALPELHGRLHAARRLDPSAVLSHAALTVCHGGSGTVYQSLASGVPLLCLPSNPDQGLVAAAVEAAGAGRRALPAERAAGRPVRRALEALLGEPGYGERARALARALAQRDTRGRWLEFLAAVLPRSEAGLPSRARREPNARALSEVAS